MSIGNILTIARNSLAAHQAATQVTGNNIANAQTEGYSRQRAELSAARAVETAVGRLGTGVSVADISRAQAPLLEAAFRRENTNAAGFTLRHDLLSQVEGVFGGLTDTGFAATLDAFWSSWADLANNPTDGGARRLVQQHGEQVAFAMNGFAAQLDHATRSAEERAVRTVDRLNDLARQTAELNGKIATVERGGSVAGDLRDRRDVILDEMSGISDVRVLEQRDGGVNLVLAGTTMVDGVDAKQLEIRREGGTLSVGVAGRPASLRQQGGTLAAALEIANRDLPETHARLNELAANLAERVNTLHQAGTGASGETDVPFFKPDGLTADGFDLSNEVREDPDRIAAGYTDAPGDNELALELAALRDDPALAEAFRGMVTELGAKVSAAGSSADVFGTLAAQMDQRRTGAKGVSVDEELTRLIGHQQAYTAAARLVNVADEMARTILELR